MDVELNIEWKAVATLLNASNLETYGNIWIKQSIRFLKCIVILFYLFVHPGPY